MNHPFAKIFGFLLGAFLLAGSLQAQDVIYKKNGQVLQTKVVELGTGEIKYRLADQPDGPIYVVEKESILKIIFQDGHVEFYGAQRMDEAQTFEGQRTKNLKISFLGPLLGYTNVLYEQNIKPGRSWEVKGTFIGLGKQIGDRPRGFIGSAAYKFYKKPTFYTNDLKRTHLMQGGYIKPEFFLGFSSYDYDLSGYGNDTRKSSTAAGVLLNLGKQWVFDDAFVLDLSFGIGYGAGTSTRSIYTSGDAEVGLAGTVNMNIGWMLK